MLSKKLVPKFYIVIDQFIQIYTSSTLFKLIQNFDKSMNSQKISIHLSDMTYDGWVFKLDCHCNGYYETNYQYLLAQRLNPIIFCNNCSNQKIVEFSAEELKQYEEQQSIMQNLSEYVTPNSSMLKQKVQTNYKWGYCLQLRQYGVVLVQKWYLQEIPTKVTTQYSKIFQKQQQQTSTSQQIKQQLRGYKTSNLSIQ